MDQVSSPEQIDDYVKVTTPPVWLVLAAIFLIFAGVIIWAVFGTITVNTSTGVETVAPITFLLP